MKTQHLQRKLSFFGTKVETKNLIIDIFDVQVLCIFIDIIVMLNRFCKLTILHICNPFCHEKSIHTNSILTSSAHFMNIFNSRFKSGVSEVTKHYYMDLFGNIVVKS